MVEAGDCGRQLATVKLPDDPERGERLGQAEGELDSLAPLLLLQEVAEPLVLRHRPLLLLLAGGLHLDQSETGMRSRDHGLQLSQLTVSVSSAQTRRWPPSPAAMIWSWVVTTLHTLPASSPRSRVTVASCRATHHTCTLAPSSLVFFNSVTLKVPAL